MRLARKMTVTAGACALTAAAVVSAGSVVSVAGTGASARQADVVIRPGVQHAGHANSVPPTTAYCEKTYKVACYEAGQIQRAYNLAPLFSRGVNGKGTTIVIVDSFGSPTIRHDLGVFDKTFGLPAPPSLSVIQPAGKVPAYNPNNSDMVGWAGETTLDVEYAHTMAPGAKILLVETPVSETEGVTGFPQIVTAEKYVIDHHLGGVISQSFSATEKTFPSKTALLALRGAYQDAYQNGVTVLAASGDSGAADVGLDQSTYYTSPVTSWPDSDPLVTGVGGTQLHLSASGAHTAPDNVWNDTYSKATNEFILGDAGPNPLAGGGGKSIFFHRPSYQALVRGVVGTSRGVPDISMSAACNGAVDIYQSFGGQPAGWYPSCGTSEATPLFAGVVALADQVAGHPLGLINPALYVMSAARAPGIVDITKGSNTVSFSQGGHAYTVHGYSAQPGYDMASGVGTVDAARFVPELALLAGH
jgi:subtilase family serine protease